MLELYSLGICNLSSLAKRWRLLSIKGKSRFDVLQAHTCANLLEMPDYWAALSASELVVRKLQDPSQGLDLDAELAALVDQRLRTAVTMCCSYELAGPASEGRALHLLGVIGSKEWIANHMAWQAGKHLGTACQNRRMMRHYIFSKDSWQAGRRSLFIVDQYLSSSLPSNVTSPLCLQG